MSKEKQVHIRITDEEKEKMVLKANDLGFKQLSEYLRFVGLNTKVDVTFKESIKDSSIVKFAKYIFSKEIQPTENNCILYHKIIEILDDSSKFKIIKGIRQSGKSFLLKTLALYTAFHNENKTIGIVSYDDNASNIFMKNLQESYKNILDKPGVIIWNKNQLSFDNGSSIFCTICSPDAFRGMGIDLILLDEMAFFDNKKVADLWQFNMPCLYERNGSFVAASTIKNRSQDNFFWQLWSNNQGIYDEYTRFTITSKDIGRNGKSPEI